MAGPLVQVYGHQAFFYGFDNEFLPYRLLYPKNYNPKKKYPVIINTQGSNQLGRNNTSNVDSKWVFPFYYYDSTFLTHVQGDFEWTFPYNNEDLECFVLSPQSPTSPQAVQRFLFNEDSVYYNAPDNGSLGRSTAFHLQHRSMNENGWFASACVSLLYAMKENDFIFYTTDTLDSTTDFDGNDTSELAAINFDMDRIYYTGFSYGGKGCFEFLKHARELLAGVLVCDGFAINNDFTDPSGDEDSMARLRQEVERWKHIPVFMMGGIYKEDGIGMIDNMRAVMGILEEIGGIGYLADSGKGHDEELLEVAYSCPYTQPEGTVPYTFDTTTTGEVELTQDLNPSYGNFMTCMEWLFQQNKQNNPDIEPDPYPNGNYTDAASSVYGYLHAGDYKIIIDTSVNNKFQLLSPDTSATVRINGHNFEVSDNDGAFNVNYNGEIISFDSIEGESHSLSTVREIVTFTWEGTGSHLFSVDVDSIQSSAPISESNFIVVYELGNLDSTDFAAYYAGKHGLTTSASNPSFVSTNTGAIGGINWEVNGQLLGIQLTDNSEILDSEDDFNTQLLNPILDAISNSNELSNLNIWGIVLAYRIPGGFYSGDDVVSSTSRISRLNFSFSKKTLNKLYNRSLFQRIGATDATYALVCSRIDAPNLQAAKTYLDNAEKLNEQVFANGTFYFDQYSDRADAGTTAYQEILSNFDSDVLPSLNLDTWSTTFQDPYIDSVIPFVEHDSFVWSWFTDRATSSFFRYSNALRVFFYNADYDGGFSVRDENGKTWPFLSMTNGYVASAGAMSNPTILGFLNPNSFYNALLRGATIGEAFLFSVPHLDWTISLFGDPLTYCSFPASEVPDEDLRDQHEVWNDISKDLARAVAHLSKKADELREVVDEIVDLTRASGVNSELSIEDILLLAPPFKEVLDAGDPPSVILLYPANDLYVNNNGNTRKSQMKPLVDTFFDFPRLRYYYQATDTLAPDINTYLTDQGFKVSRILADITGSAIIEDDNLLDEGWWQFEFVVEDDDPDNYVNYHFQMDVATDSAFDNIIISKDSYSIRNWTYEKEKDVFVSMTFSGVTSSYIGRKVRYESRQDPLISLDEYLTRGETYYFRITQYNLETSEEYSPREYNDIIYS